MGNPMFDNFRNEDKIIYIREDYDFDDVRIFSFGIIEEKFVRLGDLYAWGIDHCDFFLHPNNYEITYNYDGYPELIKKK